ncbi:MAG: DUF2339 domain-containing protein [Planctomycetota bacterium]|nr:DUF2339 domain-containing protein [Planctomycetota bacterium]
MSKDERLEQVEKSLSELLDRIERLEQASLPGDRPIGGPTKAGFDPATSRDEPSDAPTGHPTAADEATPTVPSAASLSSIDEVDDAPPTVPPPPPPPSPTSRSSDVEKVIGTRITAIVGGLLVVAAAAFFAKLAFDRGWIGAIPPIVRALLLGGAGVAMLVLADLLRQRLGRPAAVGLAMAGLGTLYVDGWAMGPVLALVGPIGSLVAMGIAAGIGLLATIRFGSRLVGAASIVAAVAAPYLAGGDGGHVAAGSYFTAIFVVTFGLGMVRPRPFLGLRWIGFTVLVVGVAPWLLSAVADSAWETVLLTTIAWWSIVHASSIQAAHRGFEWRHGVGLMIASTVLLAIPIPLAMRNASVDSVEGWVPFGLGLLCVAFAFQSGVGLGAFKQVDVSSRRRDRCLHALAGTAWLEGITLVMLSAALLLPALGIPLAWAVTAVALAVHGRRFRSLATSIAAFVVVLAAQIAASIVTVSNWGGPDWFEGTPWEMEPVAEAITIPIAWASAVALGVLWPVRRPSMDSGDRAGVALVPSLIVLLGLLPVLLPAVFIGDMGWWIPVSALPFLGSALIARFRGERAPSRFGTLVASLCLLILSASFLLGTILTIEEGDPSLAAVLVVYAILAMPILLLDVRGPARAAGGTPLPSDVAACFVLGMSCGAALVVMVVGELQSGLDAQKAFTAFSIPILAGPFILGLMRRHGRHLVRPLIPATMAGFAVLAWAIGTVGMLGEVASMAEDGIGFVLPIWTGLVLLVLLACRCRVSEGISMEMRASDGCLAVIMGLATGSIIVYVLLGPGTILAQAGLSIWWASYAIGMVVIGFMRAIPLVRHAGLGLLGITALKFLVMDLSGTQPEYRVVSALGIGLLMVGTSVVYARFGRRLDADSARDTDPG